MSPAEILERIRRQWEERAVGPGGVLAPVVALDWRAYFQAFCEEHGRFPLVFQGRLLFPDGWTYSATDHSGPEWPPPEDEDAKKRLCRAYWKLRRKAVRVELVKRRLELRELNDLIARKSVRPIEQVTMWNEETERYETKHRQADPTNLEQRVAWLERDLEICQLRIIDPFCVIEEVESAT